MWTHASSFQHVLASFISVLQTSKPHQLYLLFYYMFRTLRLQRSILIPRLTFNDTIGRVLRLDWCSFSLYELDPLCQQITFCRWSRVLPRELWMCERIQHPRHQAVDYTLWLKSVESDTPVRLSRADAVHEDFHTTKKRQSKSFEDLHLARAKEVPTTNKAI